MPDKTMDRQTINGELFMLMDSAAREKTNFLYDTYSYTSCDDVDKNSILFVDSVGGQRRISDYPINIYDGLGWLVTTVIGNIKYQYAVSWKNTKQIKQILFRTCYSGTWQEWIPIEENTMRGWAVDNGVTSCDNIGETCWYMVSSSGGVPTPADFPFASAGWLHTVVLGNFRLQIAFSFDVRTVVKIRTRTSASRWNAWRVLGGSEGESTGWIQPVDSESSSDSGKTDMTDEIQAMLNSTGYCHLGPGIFYVRGGINLPAGATLEGCGDKTILRLLTSVSDGYICRVHTKSTIRGIRFSGGYNQLDISSGNIGGRKGIVYIGNRDGTESGVTPRTTTCCVVENCFFENLDSGIYGHNAGGGLQEGLICNNCYITRCKAGINIDYWTEYCKFTNVITFQCYYACINNGGNNVFTGCTFHGVIGFVIDNSSGTKSNCAHGTANGCTFNHIDNMNHPETLGNGYGVKVIDADAGFIFSNCQFWYSKVYVEESLGVQFSDCEFGGYPTIETSGTGCVFFDGCIFQSAPTKTITSPVKFDACYTYAGAEVTA